MAGRKFAIRRSRLIEFSRDSSVSSTRNRLAKTTASKRFWRDDQVAAGFFFTFGFAVFGCATGSGPRSMEVRRPAVKV